MRSLSPLSVALHTGIDQVRLQGDQLLFVRLQSKHIVRWELAFIRLSLWISLQWLHICDFLFDNVTDFNICLYSLERISLLFIYAKVNLLIIFGIYSVFDILCNVNTYK